MYVEARPAVGQIVVSLHAELQNYLMNHSALVIVSTWFWGLLCGEIGETNPTLCSEQWHIRRSFAGLLKALSLRPTFQPTSTPLFWSRHVRQPPSLLNKCEVRRISGDPKHVQNHLLQEDSLILYQINPGLAQFQRLAWAMMMSQWTQKSWNRWVEKFRGARNC